MSTLVVVEEILREANQPLSVREIVERAGSALPTRSKTPDTVVARDLSMDIKRKGADVSQFVRTSPGRYTLRALLGNQAPAPLAETASAATPTPIQPAASAPTPMSQSLGERAGTRPATAPPTSKPTTLTA
jgi:hypothetical protein